MIQCRCFLSILCDRAFYMSVFSFCMCYVFVVLNKEECTYCSGVCCIIGLTWILVSRSFSGGWLLVFITLCQALWNTEVKDTVPTLHMLINSLQSHDELKDSSSKFVTKVCGPLSLGIWVQSRGEIGLETSEKTLSSGWHLSWTPRIRGVWLRRKRECPAQSWEEAEAGPGCWEVYTGVRRSQIVGVV